tara:strand:- start:383 stop:616 length:234 start_codon:yes stop_codon:yes gene_type:complete
MGISAEEKARRIAEQARDAAVNTVLSEIHWLGRRKHHAVGGTDELNLAVQKEIATIHNELAVQWGLDEIDFKVLEAK